MTVSLDLTKGQTVVLKGAQKVLDAMVGLGWDASTTPGKDFDLDAVMIARDAAGATRSDWVLYFGSTKDAKGKPSIGWASHSGDALTGEGEMDSSGDDEQIKVDLSAVPADVNHLDFLVIIYDAKARKQTFGDLTAAHVRLVNGETGAETGNYQLTSDDMFAGEGMLFAQIVRHGPTWDFKIVAATKPEYADVNSAANATSTVA